MSKKKISLIASLLITCLTANIKAQEAKDQSGQVNTLKAGNYRAVNLIDDE